MSFTSNRAMLLRHVLARGIARRVLVHSQALPHFGRVTFFSTPRWLTAATARPSTTDHERDDARSDEQKPTTVQGEEVAPRQRPSSRYRSHGGEKSGKLRQHSLKPGTPQPAGLSWDEWSYGRLQWLRHNLTISQRSLPDIADWARQQLSKEPGKPKDSRTTKSRRTAMGRAKWLLHHLEKEGANFQAVYDEKALWFEEETALRKRKEAGESAPMAEAGGSAAESNTAEVAPISEE